jgi:hypothetical protein
MNDSSKWDVKMQIWKIVELVGIFNGYHYQIMPDVNKLCNSET